MSGGLCIGADLYAHRNECAAAGAAPAPELKRGPASAVGAAGQAAAGPFGGAASARKPAKHDETWRSRVDGALAAVQLGELSQAAASRSFGVAKSTLNHYKRCGGKRRKTGAPVSRPVEEDVLVRWMAVCAQLGWPQ